jgi:hypothetical protein
MRMEIIELASKSHQLLDDAFMKFRSIAGVDHAPFLHARQ